MTIATPTGVLLGRAAPHSTAWHEMRAGGIGASEVAAVLGISPWQSPYSLWWAKHERWTSEPNRDQQWGTVLEAGIREVFAEDHPDVTVGPTGTWRHRTRGWQRCNPDALIWERQITDPAAIPAIAGLEVKVSNADDEWGTPGTDEIPAHYRTQVMWCMDVLGVDTWHVAVSRWGRYPDYYIVKYDPDEARLLRGHCAAFWRSLQHGQPPELDGHDATLQAVRRLHPDIDGQDVRISTILGMEFWARRRMLAEAEEADRRTTAELLQAMGSARRAVVADDIPVARRQPGRGGSVSLYNLAPKGNR